jgi:hypothetical protein
MQARLKCKLRASQADALEGVSGRGSGLEGPPSEGDGFTTLPLSEPCPAMAFGRGEPWEKTGGFPASPARSAYHRPQVSVYGYGSDSDGVGSSAPPRRTAAATSQREGAADPAATTAAVAAAAAPLGGGDSSYGRRYVDILTADLLLEPDMLAATQPQQQTLAGTEDRAGGGAFGPPAESAPDGGLRASDCGLSAAGGSKWQAWGQQGAAAAVGGLGAMPEVFTAAGTAAGFPAEGGSSSNPTALGSGGEPSTGSAAGILLPAPNHSQHT